MLPSITVEKRPKAITEKVTHFLTLLFIKGILIVFGIKRRSDTIPTKLPEDNTGKHPI